MRTGLLSWKERGWLWLRLGIRLFLFCAALFLLGRFGRRLLTLFGPFLAALVAAALLDPLIQRLQRRTGGSRKLLTLVLLVVLLGAVGGLLAWLIYAAGKELVSLAEHWGDLLATAQNVVSQLDGFLDQLASALPFPLTPPDQSLLDRLLELLQDVSPDLGGLLTTAGQRMRSVSSFLLALVFFLMATYLLTADYPYLRSRAARNMSDGVLEFCRQVRTTAIGAFGGYLRAQLLLTGGVFLILLAGFLLTRQDYGLLLAVGLALLDFIPIVGSGTVMVPWALVAFFSGDLRKALGLLVIWGIIVLFRRVAEPKFVGDQTGLSPLLTLLSIYVGMKVAGVPGMILAPILVLMCLNLAGMGVFRGLRLDLEAAWRDVAAILSRRPGES